MYRTVVLCHPHLQTVIARSLSPIYTLLHFMSSIIKLSCVCASSNWQLAKLHHCSLHHFSSQERVKWFPMLRMSIYPVLFGQLRNGLKNQILELPTYNKNLSSRLLVPNEKTLFALGVIIFVYLRPLANIIIFLIMNVTKFCKLDIYNS